MMGAGWNQREGIFQFLRLIVSGLLAVTHSITHTVNLTVNAIAGWSWLNWCDTLSKLLIACTKFSEISKDHV